MASPLKIGSFVGIANVMNETKFRRRTRMESSVNNVKCSEADEILITNGSEDNTFNIRARSDSSLDRTSESDDSVPDDLGPLESQAPLDSFQRNLSMVNPE